MGNTTDFLVSHGSFTEGMGRIFDLSGSMNVYSYSANEAEADARAMASDFGMVGQDMRKALSNEQEQTQGAAPRCR